MWSGIVSCCFINSLSGILLFTLILSSSMAQGQTPSVEVTMKFKPRHADIEYEIPKPSEYKDCKVSVEKDRSGASGFVVKGPNNQILRRFIDSNGDQLVDMWRYYNHGLEVYRDIDSNFNKKVDQSRWLNNGGTRWGFDKDEDGRIDEWKVISAEEATKEAVSALVANDVTRLAPLLMTTSDMQKLSIDRTVGDRIQKGLANADSQLRKNLSSSRAVSSKTRWMRFEGSVPCLVPKDEGKAGVDLWLYENAMAITETDGKPGLVQIGELVRVGDSWKLTQIPLPLDPTNSTQLVTQSFFMNPGLGAEPTAYTGKYKELLDKLQVLDQNAPSLGTSREALYRYNKSRIDLLTSLIQNAPNETERTRWIKQMAEGLLAAIQTQSYPEGLTRLKSLDDQVKKSNLYADLRPYVAYRNLLANYSEQTRKMTNENREKVQEWWLGQLEAFVKTYPKAEDTSEALFQLGFSQEISGNVTEAKKWYEMLSEDHATKPSGLKGIGALRRLGSVGKAFELAGKTIQGQSVDIRSYKNRAVLVLFWATWCKPCTEDLPQIKALYQQYRGKGFEILGVNVDATTEQIGPYIKEYQVPWPHLRGEGGLDSPAARHYGIISLPTMFLIDKTGKVISNNVSVENLKKVLPDLLK